MEKRTQSLSTAYKQSGMFKAFGDVLWDLPIEDRQKLWRLYEEARHYHNEVEVLNNMKYEETLVTCSEVACSTLFARLRTLPRELRDEVYTYLWDDETINKVQSLWDRYSNSHGKEERRRSDKLACPISRKYCVCNISSDLPIFARYSYACNLAAEAISIFFRNISCLTLHAKDIEEQLGEWFFASGVQARDHIRHLQVKIDTDLLEWELRILDIKPERLDTHPYNEVITREDAALKQNLSNLSTIRSGENFHLELIFSSKIHLTFALLHTLEIVKPIFRTLVDQCKFKITILPTIKEVWRMRDNVASQRRSYDRVHSHEYLFTPEDFQAYFDKTPNEWLLMMEAKDAETAERKRIRPEMERLGLIEKHDSGENGL